MAKFFVSIGERHYTDVEVEAENACHAAEVALRVRNRRSKEEGEELESYYEDDLPKDLWKIIKIEKDE